MSNMPYRQTMRSPWCQNRKGRTLTLVYLRVTAPMYSVGLKSPPIITPAAPTIKPGDIPLNDSLVGDYWTDANEQSCHAQWGGKRNTLYMNCLKNILLYFRNYYTRKTENNIFVVSLINILCLMSTSQSPVVQSFWVLSMMIVKWWQHVGRIREKISLVNKLWSIPVAASTKALICGRSLAVIADSNPAGDRDVCLLCCQVGVSATQWRTEGGG